MEAPEFFYHGDNNTTSPPESNSFKKRPTTEQQQHFMVDDLLDFPNEEDDHDALKSDVFFGLNDNNNNNNMNNSNNIICCDNSNSSGFGSNDSCNSSGNASYYQNVFPSLSHFSSDLCVPYEDMAELEWLSNFVEDSFSTQTNYLNVNLIGTKPNTPESCSSEIHPEPITRNPNNSIFSHEASLRGKARSKRSRVAPCDWATRLLHITPTTKLPSKKKENPNPSPSSNSSPGSETALRRCLHCAAEKTPQWRTGPMGPKTLCNACGVRYKSGRLVPEYRPAASPTFVPTRHSNSHRKVVELRRQKDLHRVHQEQQYLNQSSIFGVPNGSGHDFMIHHHNGPAFRHMI